MDVGILLRNARERRRLSIEELSAATKIPATVLRAMEAGDFARVPGGIFARGFLRAVAREIGLDPEEVVAQYLAELDLQHRAQQPAPPAGAAAPSATPPARRRAAQIVWLTAAAVAWIVTARTLSTDRPLPALPEPAPIQAPASVPPSQAPVALASSAPAAEHEGAPIGTSGRPLRVLLHPHGDCWVEATADGAPAVYRLMRAGEQQAIDVESELVLRVGDPSAFAFEINGSPGRALGKPATPAVVRITPDDYRALLARAM